MSRDFRANKNLICVSANAKETAINTEQTLDTTLRVSVDTIFNLKPRRETNADEQTGKEEPDTIYKLGALTEAPLTYPKAMPQHFGFVYGYGLGAVSSAAWGTGYKHTITPIESMYPPGFTAAGRYGKTVGKRRFASNYIDSATSEFAKDSWLKLSTTVAGTGKYTNSVSIENVTAAYDATSLTLAGTNIVQGSTAAERLDNVHRIRVQDVTDGQWVEVSFSAVSAGNPGVTPSNITISAPGGVVTSTTYEITYVATEAAWATFPAIVTESPLRVTDLVLKIGGKWNGSAFLGGRTLAAEINSVSYNLQNQLSVEFRVGGTGDYANYVVRKGRMQTLTLNREMRDFILQRHLEDNEYFGVYMKATGDEFESGKNYYVEMVFPRCGVIEAPISVSDKVNVEAGNLQVLEDDTYGSVWMQVANKVATYAA